MHQIDVHKLSDQAKFNGFHRLVLLACALIIIFDGYDLAVVGIALPSIMKGMRVDATSAGFMVSAALFGMMFGNILFGTLADRIGRRRVVVICITLFSLFTAAAGFTSDSITFSIARFIAGVGIGGVMPIVVAQMTEYSPLRIRSTLSPRLSTNRVMIVMITSSKLWKLVIFSITGVAASWSVYSHGLGCCPKAAPPAASAMPATVNPSNRRPIWPLDIFMPLALP